MNPLQWCYSLCIFLPYKGWIQKDASATDYSDINELAEEDEEKYYKHAAATIFSHKKVTTSAGEKYRLINPHFLFFFFCFKHLA